MRFNQPPGDARNNALWGKAGTGSGKRGNALWGRGGRGRVFAVIAALALVIPLGAAAQRTGGGAGIAAYVAPGLVGHANKNPSAKLHLIVRSDRGAADARTRSKGAGGELRRQLGIVGAVAIDIPAGKLNALAQNAGLTITADAPVRLNGAPYSKQTWPYESGNAKLWGTGTHPATATIAIVDSGIDADRADFDFGARVLPQVTMTTLTPNARGDGRGHGTFVAGVAAGSAPGYAGAAPNATLLPIDVMDDSGKALTSDVIAACDYILRNKSALNIRVANFSLHSAAKNHFYLDPLDLAVEKLWFNGVFVVAAAGNYGFPTSASGVLHAPGNDPFVMTVGAVDIGSSIRPADDVAAPWSAYGRTEDGFWKPELGAPGRFMVGPVPQSSTLVSQRADHVVTAGYMELSGTSFAAPVVAGTAAQIIARHPDWTNDQIKGALMLTAKPVRNGAPGSSGVGQLNAASAAGYRTTPPNANAGLLTFLKAAADGTLAFDAVSWNEVVNGSASWAEASWGDASWGDASWNTASWADLSFSAASWAEGAYADASWADASWADTSTEDSAEGDNSEGAAGMDATTAAELQSDPVLALSADQASADPSVGGTTSP